MFGSLIKSTIGVVTDAATIAVAPVAIVAEVASAATKPIAEAAEEIVKDVHDTLKED